MSNVFEDALAVKDCRGYYYTGDVKNLWSPELRLAKLYKRAHYAKEIANSARFAALKPCVVTIRLVEVGNQRF